MDLSIIILNYQSKGLLKQCLRGLANARLPVSHEIIVVDNDSQDSTTTMVRSEFHSVRLVVSPVNAGCAAGNNLGMLAARGRYFLILNPDIAVFPGVIERLIQFLDDHTDAALVAPKLVNPDGSIQLSCYRFPDWLVPMLRRTPLGRLTASKRHLRSYLMLDWQHDRTRTVDWVLGACMLVRGEAVESVGLMDERFFMYFEDVDWCRRFWQAGFRIYYHPECELVHFHQRISAVNPGLRGIFSATTRTHILSGLTYFFKYGFTSRPPLVHETLPSS